MTKRLKELMAIINTPEPVSSMSTHERCWHMAYRTPRTKDVWRFVAPRGVWLLRLLSAPIILISNAVILYLVYQLVMLNGIPVIGNLQL